MKKLKSEVFNLSIPYLIIFLLILFFSFAFTGSYTGFFAYNETNMAEEISNESVQEILLNDSEIITENGITNVSEAIIEDINEVQKEIKEIKEVKLNEELKDDEGSEIARKIKDDDRFETYFTYTNKTDSRLELSFYHDSDEIQKVWVEGDVNYQLSTDQPDKNEIANLSVDLIDGKIPRFKLHIGDESEVFEFGITIINVYSHPVLYGNWTVMFNTTGTADLRITAALDINYTAEATRWTNYSENESLHDLKFLELKCGPSVLNYEWQGTNCNENECSVFIPNYSCNETAYEVSKVIKSGKHVLRFDFGDDSAFAYNANSIPVVSGVYLNSTTNGTCGALYSNLTVNFTASDADGNNTKNITTWYLNNNSIMVLNMPFEGGSNSTYTKDYSGFNHNANVSGATFGNAFGYDGFGAYQFDGTNDFLRISKTNTLNITENMTVLAWIYTNKTAERIVNKWSTKGWLMDIAGGGIRVRITDGTNNVDQNPTVYVNDFKWHLVGFTMQRGSATGLRIYVDGKNITTASLASVTVGMSNENDIGIGVIPSAAGAYFNGTIDDVRIYNRTLSKEQIIMINNSRDYTLSSNGTLVNEVWQANVTVNDGVNDSLSVESNYLEIVSSCPAADTCAYSSGNWNVNCADNCAITSNVNLVGNNIYFTNAGSFYVKASIENYGLISLSDGCNIVMYDNGKLGGA